MRNDFESLVQFAAEIERIENVKNDFIVPAVNLKMVDDKNLSIDNEGIFDINDYCHGQIADKVGMPRKYYDVTGQIPGLRTLNVNAWIREKDETRFVRTLDGKARAFLSDMYKPMDNYDVLSHSIFPAIKAIKQDIKVKACVMSETRMYIQFVIKSLRAEIKKGDIVEYGLTMSNSEVGAGSLKAEGWFNRLVCDNGMIRHSLFKKYHISRRTEDEEMKAIYQKDTIEKELESYQLRLRDVIKHVLNKDTFEKEVDKLREASKDKISNAVPVVKNVTKRFGLTEGEGDRIVQNMVDTNEFTRWGIANGITAMAHSIENPDRQYHYEKLGSQIIDLSPSDWKVINESEK